VTCSRAGGACSGGTIVGGDGGRFELGRSSVGPDLGSLGPICVRAGQARLCCLWFEYEQFVMGGGSDDTAPTAALLRELCGPI
jgi:hypothetical protein